MLKYKMTDDDWSSKVARGETMPRMNRAIRLMEPYIDFNNSRGFDFGCGEGVFMRVLNERGSVMYGCDPSPDLIKLAPTNAVVGDFTRLKEFDDGFFDFFLCFQVVSFLDKPGEFGRTFAEASRVLRTGGVFLLTILNSRMTKADARHPHVADPDTLKDYLLTFGLNEMGQTYDNTMRRLPWRLLNFSRRNERTQDDEELARFPDAHKRQKSTAIISVSVKA